MSEEKFCPEIPLMLTFKSPKFLTHQKKKQFITTLYSYDYEGTGIEEVDEDEESEIHFSVEEKEAKYFSEVIEKKQKRRRPLTVVYSSTEEDEYEISPTDELVETKVTKVFEGYENFVRRII